MHYIEGQAHADLLGQKQVSGQGQLIRTQSIDGM